MKEAVGGTSLFVIVLSVMTVFAIYISLSVNWNMAYKAKDEIVFAIEKNKGVNKQSLDEISYYLSNAGYYSTGNCGCASGYTVGTKKTKDYSATGDNSANYCIIKTNYANDNGFEKAYYSVRVFFKLDLPIIRHLDIKIDGETRVIENPVDFTTGNNMVVERNPNNTGGFTCSNGCGNCSKGAFG